MTYSVLIRDTHTGESVTYHDDGEWLEFQWREGNYSCDCNRMLFFARARGAPEPDDPPCGADRFAVELVTRPAGYGFDEVLYRGRDLR